MHRLALGRLLHLQLLDRPDDRQPHPHAAEVALGDQIVPAQPGLEPRGDARKSAISIGYSPAIRNFSQLFPNMQTRIGGRK